MFTGEDGNTINNEDRKKFYLRKILKCTQFCKFSRALGKTTVFNNCSSSI